MTRFLKSGHYIIRYNEKLKVQENIIAISNIKNRLFNILERLSQTLKSDKNAQKSDKAVYAYNLQQQQYTIKQHITLCNIDIKPQLGFNLKTKFKNMFYNMIFFAC